MFQSREIVKDVRKTKFRRQNEENYIKKQEGKRKQERVKEERGWKYAEHMEEDHG